MSGPVYLYSEGIRVRHIADPAQPSDEQRSGYGFSLCGRHNLETDEGMVEWQRRIFAASTAEFRIARKREAPVCKLCQKAWENEDVCSALGGPHVDDFVNEDLGVALYRCVGCDREVVEEDDGSYVPVAEFKQRRLSVVESDGDRVPVGETEQ